MMVCFFISVSMSTVGDNILNKPLPKVGTLHVLYINGYRMSYGERNLCNFCINFNILYKATCQYWFLCIQNISFLKTCLLTSAISSTLQTFAVPL